MDVEADLLVGKKKLKQISFDLIDINNDSVSFHVTLIRSLSGLDIDKLFSNAEKYKGTFRVSKEVQSILEETKSVYFHVTYSNPSEESDRYHALVYAFPSSYYGLYMLGKTRIDEIEVQVDKSLRSMLFYSKQMWLDGFKKYQVPNVATSEISFNMSPPKSSLISRKSALEGENTLHFICAKYYDILYSLHTPLFYFPKTALTRLHILCEAEEASVSSVLTLLRISIEELDRRHGGDMGLLEQGLEEQVGHVASESKTFIRSFEAEYKKKFLKQFSRIIKDSVEVPEDPEKALSSEFDPATLILKLKLRESQLQCLILLELIFQLGIRESEILDEYKAVIAENEKNKKQLWKKSFIRRKNVKNSYSVKTTFLGRGYHLNEVDPKSIKKRDSMIYDINVLIEKMSVWDTILPTEIHTENETFQGFVIYVIVPYFKQKLPEITKFIVQKVKSMNLKLYNRIKKSSNKAGSKRDDIYKNKIQNIHSESSKFAKQHLNLARHPNRQNLSEASKTELQHQISLKRSKSNLTNKNLQKRQVDISSSLMPLSNSQASTNEEKAKRSLSVATEFQSNHKQSIFGKAKRSKSTFDVDAVAKCKSISQVGATPVKKKPEILSFPYVTSPTSTAYDQARQNPLTPTRKDINNVQFVTPEPIASRTDMNSRGALVSSPMFSFDPTVSKPEFITPTLSKGIIQSSPTELFSSPLTEKNSDNSSHIQTENNRLLPEAFALANTNHNISQDGRAESHETEFISLAEEIVSSSYINTDNDTDHSSDYEILQGKPRHQVYYPSNRRK